MKDVGILVIADGIDETIRNRFRDCFKLSHPKVSYDILMMGDVIPTQKIFNKCKLLNKGLKQLISQEYKCILQTDIDLICPPKTLDWTVRQATNIDACIHHPMKCIAPAEFKKYKSYSEYPFKEWSKIKSVYATGCWNCMKPHLWQKSGGFNEDMTLWGYEDRDWRYRAIAAGISWVDEYKYPLIHVNHPRRNRDVSKKNLEIAKDAKSQGKVNWL